MKKLRVLFAFFVIAAMLISGGAFALEDGHGAEFEDGINGLMLILPMTYWHT